MSAVIPKSSRPWRSLNKPFLLSLKNKKSLICLFTASSSSTAWCLEVEDAQTWARELKEQGPRGLPLSPKEITLVKILTRAHSFADWGKASLIL